MKHVNKHLNVNLLGPNCYDFFKNFFYVTVVLGPFKTNCFPFMLKVKEISMVLKKKKITPYFSSLFVYSVRPGVCWSPKLLVGILCILFAAGCELECSFQGNIVF